MKKLANYKKPADSLKSYLDGIGIEYRFDKLEIMHSKKLQMANKVNIEHMSNNPVKFANEEIRRIFL